MDIKLYVKEYQIVDRKFIKEGTEIVIPIQKNDIIHLIEEREPDLISGGDIFDDFSESSINQKSYIKKKSPESSVDLKYLFDNNTLLDIKRYIYAKTNISIESQYIECRRNNSWECLDYKFKYNGAEETETAYLDFYTKIEDIFDSVEYINGLPIDLYMYSNRDSYSIKSNSYTSIKKFINNAVIEKSKIELRLYDLNKIIKNGSELINIISKDPDQNNMFYEGFLEKFYPMIPKYAIIEFIKNKNIWSSFKLLEIENVSILNKVEGMKNLLSNKKNSNDILSKKSNEYIKNLNFVYKSKKKYNIKQLFNSINLSKDIQKIDCFIKNKDVYLERIFKNDKPLSLKKIQVIVDDNLSMVRGTDSYLILYIKQKMKDIKTNEHHTITIYSNGVIIGKCINEDRDWSKKDLINYYYSKIIPLVNENAADLQLDVKKMKMEGEEKSLSSFILYNYSSNSEIMQNMTKLFKEYEKLEHYKVSTADSFKDLINLFVSYRKKNYFKSKFDSNDFLHILNDQYTNSENYLKMFTANSTISINPRINDIKVDFNNIPSKYYESYVELFTRIFTLAVSKINIRNIVDINKVKRIKFLRENDPVLFNIDNSYSRLCQSEQQPLVLTKEQVKKNPKLDYVKFWNFTRGEPEYYGCDSKKYKWMKFLTGSHPKNFCLPCCKKKQVETDDNSVSVYKSKHESCISKENNFSYNSSELKLQIPVNRYISNYSCKLSIDDQRFMKPSSSMYKFLERTGEIDKKLFIIGVGDDIMQNCNAIKILSLIKHKSNANYMTLFKEIIDFFILNSHIMDSIQEGILKLLFNNVQDFVKFLIENIDNTNLDYDFNMYSIVNWNYLFFEIYSIMSDSNVKFIILKEVDSGINNDSIITPHIIGGEYIYEDDNLVFLVERNINNNSFIYPIVYVDINKFYSEGVIDSIKFTKSDYAFMNTEEYINYKSSIESSNKDIIRLDFNIISKQSDIKKIYINSKYEFQYIKINAGVDIIFEISPVKKWYVKNLDKYNNYGDSDDIFKDINPGITDIKTIIHDNNFMNIFNNGNKIDMEDITASVCEGVIIGIWFKNIFIHTGIIKKTDSPAIKNYEEVSVNPYKFHKGKVLTKLDENKSLYITNSYNLLLLHVNDIMLTLKNIEIRKKLLNIINNMETKNKENIFSGIEKVLSKYPHSRYLLLTKLINNKFNSKFINNFLEYFNSTQFDFDKDSINYILNTKNKKEGIDYIKNILKDIISIAEINEELDLDIDFAKCKKDISSLYCDSGKLILSKNLYNEYLEILYEDLTNELKKKYILNYNEVKTLNLNIKSFTGSDIIIHKIQS